MCEASPLPEFGRGADDVSKQDAERIAALEAEQEARFRRWVQSYPGWEYADQELLKSDLDALLSALDVLREENAHLRSMLGDHFVECAAAGCRAYYAPDGDAETYAGWVASVGVYPPVEFCRQHSHMATYAGEAVEGEQ